jgi:hypothetical protein
VCTEFSVDADPSELAAVLSSRLAAYNTPRPIKLQSKGTVRANFLIAGPDRLIVGAEICTSESDCVEDEVQLQPAPDSSAVSE